MRKKYPHRHFVSHIVEHIIGVFVVLGIAGTSAYLVNGAFAQTLTPTLTSTITSTSPSLSIDSTSVPSTESTTLTPQSDPTLVQSPTAEIIPVAFAVTPAPVTDCSASQPMTRVLFALSQLSGGTFVLTSNSGTSDMKLSWGEYPLPNGVYVWRGIPASGFVVDGGDTGTFELNGACGNAATGEASVTSGGSAPVSTGESAETAVEAIIEMIPPHSSSFVPPILSRPSLKMFTNNVPVTDALQNFDNEEIEFRIEEAAAKKVTLVALSKETGKTTQLGNAVVDDLLSSKNTDIWVYFWDTASVSEGSYSMSAHVLRTDGTTIDTLPALLTIKHRKLTTGTLPTDATRDIDGNTVATLLTVALPEKEEILERVNEPSACMNSLECVTFCESEADEVCASYAQYLVSVDDYDASSLAEGVSAERLQLMLSEPKRRPQELPEVVTNAEEFLAYCSELANEAVCIKALIRNDLATTESLEARKAALLKETEAEARIWRERTGARGFVDSDEDGVTDYDEINMFRTDPEDEDTDHDGFIDGEEILARTNPRGDSGGLSPKFTDGSSPPDEEVQLEDPLISGTTNSTLLAVSDVSALAVGTDEEGKATVKALRLAGVSPPNSFVTLFIYSDPIVVTVKADASGSWTYTLDRELPDGTHHVISTITDGGGRILAKSAALPFVKEAAAVSVGAETLAVNPGAPTFSGASLYGMIAIVIALLGVSFSVLGFAVHNKKETDLTLHHST